MQIENGKTNFPNHESNCIMYGKFMSNNKTLFQNKFNIKKHIHSEVK